MKSQFFIVVLVTCIGCSPTRAPSEGAEAASPPLSAEQWTSEEPATKSAKPINKTSEMAIYVTPFYNSEGSHVAVGKYSQDLADCSAKTIRALIQRMKGEWPTLPVETMYVAAIRLYDLGLRDEAVYWFYSAQFRARLLRDLLAPQSVQGIGSEGFERIQAHGAFQQLVGEYVNGYTFGKLPMLEKTIRRILSESEKIPQYKLIYPGLKFIPDEDWAKKSDGTAAGLDELLEVIVENTDEIRAEREKKGMDAPVREQAVRSSWPFDEVEAQRRQEETAKALGRPVTLRNSLGMKLVLIPAGEFRMGSPEDEDWRPSSERPQHRVRITRPFYLGAYEVTQEQFVKVMGSHQFEHEGQTLPAGNVTWSEATEFCGKLARQEGKPYRLPTEAEWEYACRAGTSTAYSFGDDLASLGDYAWYNKNSKEIPHPVGQKKPNAWGLYDMHGNVYEWCSDWYDSEYYRRSPIEDPAGPVSGTLRALRSGTCSLFSTLCRSAVRQGWRPEGRRFSGIGFRVVMPAANDPDRLGQRPSTTNTMEQRRVGQVHRSLTTNVQEERTPRN